MNFKIPPYTVKRSYRAKYPRIVINSKGHVPFLEIVIPGKFDESEIPYFLENNKSWIQKTWEKQMKKSAIRLSSINLPVSIPLSAINETWGLERDESLEDSILEWDHGVLKISPQTDISAAVSLLKHWLCSKAKFHLMPSLWRLADEFGFYELKGVRIRCQKTIWASCTRNGMISLNCKNLFLPSHLVRHVFLHELCHLREMNHSPRFHSLLENFDENAKINAASIKDQWLYVPGWIEK
ncbi:MAG: M48 family metallopeptidase [Synergistaceae bacterium]|nr:M48 family metallopeptidase [Synergistaceae bacterium]